MKVVRDTPVTGSTIINPSNKLLSELDQVKLDLEEQVKKVTICEDKLKRLQDNAVKAQEEYEKALQPHIERAKKFEAKMKTITGELMAANQARFRLETIFNYLDNKPKIITK